MSTAALRKQIEATDADAEQREDVEVSETQDTARPLPTNGMQIHAQYTLYGHFFTLKTLFGGVEKLRFFLDQDTGMRAASTLNTADIQQVQETVRQRTLRLFQPRGLLTPEAVEARLHCSPGGGFSGDASVRIAAEERRGLERLLGDCARPVLAREPLSWAGEHHECLVYRLPKPMPEGRISFVSHPTGVARPTGPAHPAPAQTPPSRPRRIRPPCTPAGPGQRLARGVTGRGACNHRGS